MPSSRWTVPGSGAGYPPSTSFSLSSSAFLRESSVALTLVYWTTPMTTRATRSTIAPR
ncbi:hypothetical protein ACFWMU_20065 [Streptomyces sp. NPDC058357]|uniref:hypothetical protein n=1 Tax=unclassified Streptomyces TaxID=2593676 RepID=UPI003660A040